MFLARCVHLYLTLLTSLLFGSKWANNPLSQLILHSGEQLATASLTSAGAASASLMLSHWERLQVDPFFVPLTEEEREEFGEEGQGVGTANLARTMIDEVRSRKGLPTDKKVVEVSTKQRTRARKV